ncbi:MAG: stage II sporulation protein E [Clostridia bacterium]|nr:stage II sporulation protein E [Clostridia bacterium]
MLGKLATKQQKATVTITGGFRWENIVFGVMGCVLSQAVIMGEIRPFGPALLGAVSVWDKQKRWWVLAGTILGTLLTGDGMAMISNILVYFLIFGALYKIFLVNHQQWLIVSGLVMAIVLITKGIFIIFGQGPLYGWVATAFESLFAGLITMVTLTSLGAWEKRNQNIQLAIEDKISCFVMGLGVLLGLSDLYLASLNIQSFVSRTAVLLGAFYGGPGGAAAIGTLVGLVPSMGGKISTASIGFYALAGLLGGIFKGLGRLGILIGFALGNLMLSMYFFGQEEVVLSLLETTLAGAVFLLIPQKYLVVEKEVLAAHYPPGIEEGARKLEHMAQVFNELSKAFVPVTAVLEEDGQEKNPLTLMLHEVSGQVCQRCVHSSTCWDKDFPKTYRSMVDVFSKAEATNRIAEHYFSLDIQRRCMRLRELSTALMYQLKLYKQEKKYQDKLISSQQLVAQQLAGMAEMVKGFAQELRLRETKDEELAQYLKEYLVDDNIKVQNINVIETTGGDKEIIIVQKACPEQNWCHQFIAPKVSQILDRTYTVRETHCPTAGNKTCTYHLNPNKTYSVTTGVAMAIKEGSHVSGDSWTFINLANRKFVMVLSDGMGAGPRASRESATAINLLEQLLGAGLSIKMAVDTVNSVLYLRSGEEIFTTIDLTVINEVTGTAEFIKVGASPSFIKRRTQVQAVKAKTLPVGVFQQVEAETFVCPVQVGDLIINMSDGVFEVIDGNIDDWCRVIQALPQEDPQNIANYLIELARNTLQGKIKDDLTVLVARIDYKAD